MVSDGCQPGSWSPNGTPECSLCAVGSYSDVYGAPECKSCPGSKSTVEEGAASLLQCQGKEIIFRLFNNFVYKTIVGKKES